MPFLIFNKYLKHPYKHFISIPPSEDHAPFQVKSISPFKLTLERSSFVAAVHHNLEIKYFMRTKAIFGIIFCCGCILLTILYFQLYCCLEKLCSFVNGRQLVKHLQKVVVLCLINYKCWIFFFFTTGKLSLHCNTSVILKRSILFKFSRFLLHYKVMPCPSSLALAFVIALILRQVLNKTRTSCIRTCDLGTNETICSIVFVARKLY